MIAPFRRINEARHVPAVVLTQTNRFLAPHLPEIPEERLLAFHALVALLPDWRLNRAGKV